MVTHSWPNLLIAGRKSKGPSGYTMTSFVIPPPGTSCLVTFLKSTFIRVPKLTFALDRIRLAQSLLPNKV